MEKTGFFEEAPGVKSNMRLMCFISLLQAIFMSNLLAFSLLGEKVIQADYYYISLIVLFVIAAFVPKSIQKFAENIPKQIQK